MDASSTPEPLRRLIAKCWAQVCAVLSFTSQDPCPAPHCLPDGQAPYCCVPLCRTSVVRTLCAQPVQLDPFLVAASQQCGCASLLDMNSIIHKERSIILASAQSRSMACMHPVWLSQLRSVCRIPGCDPAATRSCACLRSCWRKPSGEPREKQHPHLLQSCLPLPLRLQRLIRPMEASQVSANGYPEATSGVRTGLISLQQRNEKHADVQTLVHNLHADVARLRELAIVCQGTGTGCA